MDREHADADRERAANERGVTVRSDANAVEFLQRHQAVAAALDRDTIVVRPELSESSAVISHELAHIAQLRSGLSASRDASEHDARERARGGGRSEMRGAPAPPLFLTLAEQITAAATKGEVFDLLRAQSPGSANTPDVVAAISARFAGQPDDLWLANQLCEHGAEPYWDAATVALRAHRASDGHWAPEAGNIGADLTHPSDPSRSVRAYFFPGSDPDLRALVFAGVHESEPEGTAVAEELRARLAFDSAAGRPPRYSTIVVPNLFEGRHLEQGPGGTPVPLADRRLIGGLDPNRNFPGDVRAGVRGGSDAAADERGRAIFTENRILMALVERFRPNRVASIHAHSLKNVQGDAPGIYVDPRSTSAQATADTQVASDMARAVAAGLPASTVASTDPHVNPLIGNYARYNAADRAAHGGRQAIVPAASPNVLYDTSAPTASRGVSAGGWFPQSSDVPAATTGGPRTTRDPVAIYTIEVPEWRSRTDAPNLVPVEQLEAHVLEEILLGAPARP